MYNTLLVLTENGICTIVINRPDKLNALNKEVLNDLDKAIDEVYRNPEIRSAIITGAGSKAFVAGADISEFLELKLKEAPALARRGQVVFDKIENSPKPIVAAVNGFALGGGCEFAMTCDMIIASETAKFGQPEIKLGTIPGAGGTQRLTKALGKAKAMELILTGRFLSAEEALFYGLVIKVVPVEFYLQEAIQLAKEIAQMSPVAVQLAKESVNRSFETFLDEGLLFERKNFYLTFASADQKEGMKAFIEKRKPSFTGK